ncbi:MAG TPA: penicillin-binding protein 2 [Gaiellaceae bacterium]|nr:penicillin-binding protein 2 [Gaiellaceae bacterium]
MNKQLLRLSVVSMVLLAILVVATTYWQSWAVAGLQDRQDNAIQQVAQLSIARGAIVGANGTDFALNTKRRVKGQTFFKRRYPQHGLAAQLVGYSTQGGTRVGLEKSLNDYLTGANTNLSNAVQRELDELGGATVHGNKLVLTLKPAVQRLALRELDGRCGAVVALNPHTGEVYAMASSPTYDQNLIEKPGGYAKILKIKGACGDASALVNNATAGLYTPGSTFKLVTAAAALDTGTFTPDSRFQDPGYCVEYGKKVYNAGNPDQNGPEAFGSTTLAVGLQHSINSVFCNVGMKLGAKTILEYTKRFGFYSTPPLETPADERAPSGLYDLSHGRSHLYWPKDFNAVDPGRLAFGQERMLATPLQMALVAATIANGGVVPRPYLVQRIVGPDGSVVSSTRTQTLGRAIKAETARELTQMMVSVVQGGTGTQAQIPGIQVAGKTGTAETAVNHVYNAWFVSFAPADNPRVAVAVVVEKQLNGFGGSVAAPIAKDVLEALLHG